MKPVGICITSASSGQYARLQLAEEFKNQGFNVHIVNGNDPEILKFDDIIYSLYEEDFDDKKPVFKKDGWYRKFEKKRGF